MINSVGRYFRSSFRTKALDIKIHTPEDFASMRKAGFLAAQVLDYIGDFIKPGVSTEELDMLCYDMIVANNAIPAPLNYRGFPKSICTSINHVVCHGIPSKEKLLKEGDIINIDVTVIVDGWHGDSSRMYLVGKKIPIKACRLVDVTYEAMMRGIEVVQPGINMNEIGRTIQEYAEGKGYSVVRDFCGHGIGKEFHTAPDILHFYNKDYNTELKPGMFFTVEPMINAGGYETKVLLDGWTAVTRDNSLSAQFEHTVGVTENGAEIFTLGENERAKEQKKSKGGM